jgi:TRAP-type mannitol/chloroaromatic compound transport system substrate-binding protein
LFNHHDNFTHFLRKSMERRSFLKKTALGVTAGAVAAPAIAQSNPTINWRMALSWPKSLDTIYGGGELICKRVAELTDGKFQIRPFAAGEIVPAGQVLDAVQAGTVEIGHTSGTYYFGKEPAFAFASTIPFGMNARQNFSWWHFGGGSQLMEPLFKEYGVVNIPGGNTGAQMGGWFRKEVKTIEDFKGLKFRIAGLAGLIIAKIGGVPQMIGAPDIYPALEKGTIDGAEWVGPYDDEKLGFNKVAKFYYYPGWWEGGPTISTMINEKKWASLPKAYQAAISTASAEASIWMAAKYDSVNPPALRRLVGSGTKLMPYPKAVLEGCEKAAYEVYAEQAAKSAHWKRIYPEWKKFRDESFLWYRVADLAYDQYTFTSKVGR